MRAPLRIFAAVAIVAGFAVQRHAGRGQRLHVAVHGADRNIEHGGQLCGCHSTPGLEQQQDRHQPARTHGRKYAAIH